LREQKFIKSKGYVRKLAFAGVIAALYATLTIAAAPIAYGPVQFRFSEALCILPFFFPFSVWGLFVGCIAANILSTLHVLDIVVGPVATLLAALCTMWAGKYLNRDLLSVKALACFPPVIFNAVIIGALIAYVTFGSTEPVGFLVAFAWVGFGQFTVMYILGLPLMAYLAKSHVLGKLMYLYGGSK